MALRTWELSLVNTAPDANSSCESPPACAEQLDHANDSGVTLLAWPMGTRVSSPLGCSEATISPDVVDLEATVAVQAAIIAELRAINAVQAQSIAALEARMAELERRLGKDSSNSSNSSKPPSSEGLRKPARTKQRGAAQAEGAARLASSPAPPVPIWPRSPSPTR
jgi:uncharacterized coiled-coil protein SlyX